MIQGLNSARVVIEWLTDLIAELRTTILIIIPFGHNYRRAAIARALQYTIILTRSRDRKYASVRQSSKWFNAEFVQLDCVWSEFRQTT